MTHEVFASTIQKTHELLKEIEEEFNWQDRPQQAYVALRVVLHTLRDRLTTHEIAQLGARLPMLIRGVYYDGWKPAEKPHKYSREEFLNKIQQEFQFSIDRPIADLVRTVLQVLHKHISAGEMGDIRTILSKEFRDLLPSE